ncbi:HIT family protein [Arcanobacterium hippocoleae]|uniref:Diadenosine tetraphosphate (Ap4A) HIT family hydrolase n=1 Tax=Arcanobacterium hippocoleae TaxID=149017 RepID=A0ABU1T0P5_9ACTO|nr:HIT family protein [Arcanobacterium hippocoleae]MDR6938946.1 diadenosine tetraphosphate (Ap4A) HIT family hydrolase [Arcanobacterium hippocoleae]
MSIFTKIIDGEIPGRFVWQDEVCVAFATIEPVEAGHVLLVPRIEVDKFYDLDPEIFAHLAKVAQIIGRAQAHAFGTSRAIMSIFGFDVPHVHLHLHPGSPDTVKKISTPKMADGAALDAAMEKLRDSLCTLGYRKNVPAEMGKLS